jgi:protein pelota
MKILKRFISKKSGEGIVKLEAEEDDDMYHLYNLIMVGDQVEASTIRNVKIYI